MGRRNKAEKELLNSSEASADARGQRVKRIRNMANLTRQQLCEKSNININSLKGWEIGRYGGLTWQGAEKIVNQVANENVQCTIDWLMYGIGVGPSVQTSVSNNITTDLLPADSYFFTQDEEEKINKELALFKKHYNDVIEFKVDDDSMTPFFHRDEYVAGIALSGEKIDQAVGLNCIVQMENGIVLLRQLRKGSMPKTYTLISLNINNSEPVIYNVKLSKVAHVIFQRKKFTCNSQSK